MINMRASSYPPTLSLNMANLYNDYDDESTICSPGAATPPTEADFFEGDNAIKESPKISLTPRVARQSVPRADGTFMIIDKYEKRALGCHNGNLHLDKLSEMDVDNSSLTHWKWHCTEKDGFKGFCNVAEGGFLGRDKEWRHFSAKVTHHRQWEYFVVNERDDGYYWIQVLRSDKLFQLSVRADGKGITAVEDGGTLWEFVKIC